MKNLKLKKIEQKEYLDTLFLLETDLADNRISLEQFDESTSILKLQLEA